MGGLFALSGRCLVSSLRPIPKKHVRNKKKRGEPDHAANTRPTKNHAAIHRPRHRYQAINAESETESAGRYRSWCVHNGSQPVLALRLP